MDNHCSKGFFFPPISSLSTADEYNSKPKSSASNLCFTSTFSNNSPFMDATEVDNFYNDDNISTSISSPSTTCAPPPPPPTGLHNLYPSSLHNSSQSFSSSSISDFSSLPTGIQTNSKSIHTEKGSKGNLNVNHVDDSKTTCTKFNRSGLNYLGGVSRGVSRSQVQAIIDSLQNEAYTKVKPWGEFFHLQNFKKPSIESSLWMSRTDRNIRYFLYNYIVLFVVLLLICILLSPSCLVVLTIYGIANIYISTKAPVFHFTQNFSLCTKQLHFILFAFCLLFLLFFAGRLVFMIFGFTLIIILLHATFHVGKSFDEIEEDYPNSDII